MKYITILLILVLISACSVQTSQEATTCPFGEVDCAYPGNCGRYTDTNNDKICDNSQVIEVQK